MNSIEPLLWMGCEMIVIEEYRHGDIRLWLWFGVVAGNRLENKDTMLLVRRCAGGRPDAGRGAPNDGDRWCIFGGLVAWDIRRSSVWQIQHIFPISR